MAETAVDDWVAPPQARGAAVDDWVAPVARPMSPEMRWDPDKRSMVVVGQAAAPDDWASPAAVTPPPQSPWSDIPNAYATAGQQQTLPASSPSIAQGLSLDEQGAGVPEGLSSGVGNVLHATREGFGAEPLGMGDKVIAALRSAGIYPPEEGGGSALQKVNEGILSPAAFAADAFMRAGGAGLRGGQQAALEVLTPIIGEQAAREIAAIPEAFPQESMGMRGVLPGSRTALHDAAEGRGTPPVPVADRAMPTLESMSASARPPVDDWVAPTSPAPVEVAPGPGTPRPELPAAQGDMGMVPPAPVSAPAADPTAPRTSPVVSGAYTMVAPEDLKLDPDRFQYKAADTRGVTGALLGTSRWEPSLADPITAWQDTDGQLYVVNGHQRTDLAQRAQAAGQADVQVPTRVFRAEDGYTPDYMRVLGAYQNIAQGSGTAIDAAKIMRGKDSVPEGRTLPGLPPRSALVQQANGLAALDDRAFGMVESGAVNPAHASLVGAAITDPGEQISALQVLQRAQPATMDQARIMVQDIQQSGFLEAAKSAQGDIFGENAPAIPLFTERARVLSNAMGILRKAKGIFGTAVEGESTLGSAGNVLNTAGNIAARTENEGLLARLDADATKRGPLSDALNAASGDLAAGKPIAAVTSQFLTQARALERRGEAAGIRPGALPDRAEPAGAAAPAVTGEAIGAGDLWRLPPEQLEAMLQEQIGSDHEKLVRALGSEEEARQFNRLDRKQNSSDPRRADEGAREFDARYGNLTPAQERLIYGIKGEGLAADDIREVLEAHNSRTDEPQDAAYEAALAMRRVSPKDLLDVPSGRQSATAQAAAVHLGNAITDMRNAGLSDAELSSAIARALVERGKWKVGDAAEIVGNFMEQLPKLDQTRQAPRISGADLLGATRAEPVRREPEPTIQNDSNQAVMPGMERSAVQAQAARDTQGRGALQADGPQAPANEGLFAPDASRQTKLYSFPGNLFDPELYRGLLGPLAKPAAALRDSAQKLTESISNGLVPMRTGTVRAQAFAADFANSLRQVMYRYGNIDREIERAFTPAQRDQMGRALDAQSVFEQQARDMAPDAAAAARAEFERSGQGIAGLNPAQRNTLEMMDRLSQDVWRQMQERGMVMPTARPIPYYFPRQLVRWSEDNGFSRVGGEGGGGGGLDQRGMNLTTQKPMRREYLTPEQTEAAARAKLGNDVQLVRDIRSLPQRLAFAQRAIAGVDLMSQIERVGKETGVNLVVRGDIPGLLNPGDYFTIADHPSFRQFVGDGWKAINVAREFEGPLRAVLTQKSPTWYRAAQGLKGGVMSAIMYSPFIHLGVELGRSLPVMPGKILTLSALRDGSRLRRDLGYMDQATRDGLAPIGNGWHADPVSIADAAVEVDRNRFIRALAGVRDAMANGAGAIGGQFLHDVVQHPHQTLLWDQVFNLQVGIYNTMRDRYVAKGFDPEVAGTMAAHIANRYAGALPSEHLSRGANMAANLLLFSRSFTLGNLGVMKDMFKGASPQVLSRIQQMAGPEVAKSAQSALRLKAISAVGMDIGLFYMANGLLQAGLQVLRQSQQQTLPAAAQQVYQQWLDESGHALSNAGNDPLGLFGVLPQHWNEPGKQNRVYAGQDVNGRGIYLRLPPGKVGEEFVGWMHQPGTMLMDKLSPLVRPIVESVIGYDSLGREIWKPNPQGFGDALDAAGAIVKHIGESLGPTSTIQGIHELWQQHVEGKPTQADPWVSAAKVLGPLTGLAQVSSGYPGGPAAGEMHAQSEREKYDLQHAMPAIRDKIISGDIQGARADMQKLNVAPGLQRYYINQTIRPGPTMGAQRRLQGAPAEILERVRRDQMMAP